MSRKKTPDEFETERKAQEYYDQHVMEIPEGCCACGGPYPDCIAGCSMYDD